MSDKALLIAMVLLPCSLFMVGLLTRRTRWAVTACAVLLIEVMLAAWVRG